MEPISLWSSLARAMTSSGNASLASSARAGHSINAATYSNPIHEDPRKDKKNILSIGRDRERGSAYHHHASRAKVPYLAIEGDWRLIEPGLLRIPDVRRDDLVEGQAMGSVRLELYAVFLGFNGQLTTDSILDVEDRGI